MACSVNITGTPTSACSYGTSGDCNADPCCIWTTYPPPPGCFKRACAGLADNSPDVCPGCNTCPGTWVITDARGNTAWAITVTGQTRVTTGSISFQYKLTSGGFFKTPGANLVKFKPGLNHILI